MSTLTDFLLARYAEEEALARAVRPIQMTGYNGDSPDVLSVFRHRERSQDGAVYSVADHESTVLLRYLAPERVLADLEAKRALLRYLPGERYAIEDILVQPYAEHPDFDPSWRNP